MKPRWNPEISLGNAVTAISMIVTFIAWTVVGRSEVTQLRKDVDRHEVMINKLIDTQAIAIQNQAVVMMRLADHLEATKGKY